MIISGGENVYSTEVEYALYEHPAVLECAVFGIPDQQWGERIKAAVVLKEGKNISEAELVGHVKARLAAYKAPSCVEFMEELPKTGTGKIYKKALRDKHWQTSTRKIN